MVTRIAPTSVDRTQSGPVREEEDSVYKFFKKFSKYLDIFRLPFKGVSAAFAWAEVIPLKWEGLNYIANQRLEIKAISSTFNLPKFFIKQVNLYKGLSDLKETLSAKTEIDFSRLTHNVKQVFFQTMTMVISVVKLPQLFDKTGVINLSKISRMLSRSLSKTENVLYLAFYSMKLVDSVSQLQAELRKSLKASMGDGRSISNKGVKALIKVGSNSVKLVSVSVTTGALFFNAHISPIVLVALASLSFAVSLTSKVVRHNNLLTRSSVSYEKTGRPSLPA